MSPPGDAQRPGWRTGAAGDRVDDAPSVFHDLPTIEGTLDLIRLTRRELDAYWLGRTDGTIEGRAEGYRRGWADCDAEIARLQRAAAEVVYFLAGRPPRDRDADRLAAERRSARWSA